MPGSVQSHASAGVHELLRQPETLLVTDAAEIVEHLSPSGEGLAPSKEGPVRVRDRLDPLARQVLEAVPKMRAAPAASIARAAGLSIEEVVRRLMELERRSMVVIDGAGWRLSGD